MLANPVFILPQNLRTTDSPTFAGIVIPNITPAANFTITQNAVVPITTVEVGAVVNTLYLKEGNVGIGTTSPGERLHVYSTANIITQIKVENTNSINTTAAALFYAKSDTADVAITVHGTGRTLERFGVTLGGYTEIASGAGNGLIIGTRQSAPLILGTNTTAAMTILNGGNVGIGMTPTVQFELSGAVGQKASGTTWSNPSDSRLKDVLGLADLQRCYDDVKALPLKRIRLKDTCFTTEQARDRTLTGFIADDVKKVIPKAVDVKPFKMVAVDDGTEMIEEQEIIEEEVTETITEIVEVDGKFIQKNVTKIRIEKRPLFDEVPLYDESGKQLIDEKRNPLKHRIPKMKQVEKPKRRQDEIEDCLTLNIDQVYMAMFGAVKMLIQKVEALEVAQVIK